MPETLWRIYVKIVIHGVQFDAQLEPEPGLEWSMTWPALDPYGQKVIGRTLANIKVGYQFRCRFSCGEKTFLTKR